MAPETAMPPEQDDRGAPGWNDDRLAEVIAEYLIAVDQGSAPSPEEVVARHPELRRPLEEFFANQCEVAPLAALRPPAPGVQAPGARRTLFDGHELVEEIARGGMGIVYRASEAALGRIVALKVILAGTLATQKEVDRFLTEARAAASLDHPNIVPIYRVAEHEGRHYYTMKLLEGGDLARHRQRYRGSHRAVAQLLETVARAVHHAHLRGVLHRDLKPANILLDATGTPHVTDFGLSKRLDGDSTLTRTGEVLGTPSYMAPEQVQPGRGRISPATDVYALGAILYDLLADRPPFREPDTLQTLRAVVDKEPVPPRQLDSGVPRDLETICLKCLAKEPRHRYGTAAELAQDLDRFLAGRPVEARRSTWLERAWSRARRKPLVAGLALGVAFLLLAGAAGSVVVSFQLRSRLHDSLRAQARAELTSDSVGRQARALQGIREAAQLQVTPDLRDDAISALAMTDLRLLQTLQGVDASIDRPAALDPGFERHAVCDARSVTVRRASDSVVLARFECGGRPGAPLFSDDGRLLAVRVAAGAGVTCRVWQLDGPAPPIHETSAADGRRPYAFQPESALLAVAGPMGQITLKDLAARGAERVLGASEGLELVEEVSFAPDGKRLAVSSRRGDGVVLRDVADGRVISSVSYVTPTLAWQPDGLNLAVVRSQVDICFVNAARARRRSGEITGNEGAVRELTFSPDGRLLGAATASGSVLLWNPMSCRPVLRCPDGRGIQFSRDGTRLAVTRWSTIEIHEIVRSPALKVLDDPRRLYGDREVSELSFCPGEERLLVAATSSRAQLFDLERGERLAEAALPAAPGAMRRWPLRQGEGADGALQVELGPPDGREGGDRLEVSSPDGVCRVRCELAEYVCFRSGASEPAWRLPREGGWTQPGPASFDARGALVGLLLVPRAVTLVSASNGSTVATLRPPEPDPPRDLALSPSGRYAVVHHGRGTLFVWDLAALAESLEPLGVRGELPRLRPGGGPLPGRIRLAIRE